MKRNFIKIVVLTLMNIIMLSSVVFGLNLNISSNSERVNIGDEIKVTVNWNENMQAADFSLMYDSKKLEFVEADIEDYYINSDNEGEVKTAWFSLDNTDKTRNRIYF